MVTIIVVTRKHTDKLNTLSNYLLIYGRKKVDETFLVKNSFCPTKLWLFHRNIQLEREHENDKTDLRVPLS